MSIIEAKNLTFSYKSDEREKVVLDNLNLNIEKGSFTAIIGHNGSGKSTFAKHMNAILLPSGGSIRVCGIDSKDEEKLYELRKSAGMVFQNPDNQIVATIVEEDVAFGLENLGIEWEEMHERVEDALKAVNMYKYRKRAPHLLSGGQKQRVAIAGILAMQPQCIILDEPTAMLDPKGRREVMDTILSLNKEKNITIIMITHYMDESVEADRVLVMSNGRIVKDGTPKQIFKSGIELNAYGLELPKPTDVANKLIERGLPIKKGVLNSDELMEELCKLFQRT